LALAGLLGARAAGTTLARPMVRVVLGGTAAMLVTALIGSLTTVVGI
jgi:VIT1/CCC1 family predicted Fe2+/Mn2+ transporter